MKTTIEIADPLFAEAQAVARREGTTLRALVEDGLRSAIERRRSKGKFRLRDGSYRGKGLQSGIDLTNWEQIRALIYEGHGG